MMYKLYSHSTEQYTGNDLSRSIPISLFSTLPTGTPDWVVPSEFEEETLQKVKNFIIFNATLISTDYQYSE